MNGLIANLLLNGLIGYLLFLFLGFLTDDLVVQEDNGNQQKYLGVCRLPNPHSKASLDNLLNLFI